ncbi:MAG TPA: S9 family peptidase [Puia sp.]|nr:S9 family peptidase [Puia sp.]
MKSTTVLLGVVLLLSACEAPSPADSGGTWPKGIHPPVAVKKSHDRILFGDTVRDNYYWMADYFSKGPDSLLAVDYLKAENAYLDTMMSGTKVFQEQLFREMKARIREDETDPPVFMNGYYYYVRKEKGQQYFKYCRRKGDTTAAEEVLLDVDQMAAGHPYFSVGAMQISPDNRLLAFSVDTVSRRQYNIYVKDLTSDRLITDGLSGAAPGLAWASDNRTLFYTRNNPVTLLTEKIVRHRLGTAAQTDKVVYTETDKSNYIGVRRSKSGKYIFISSAGTLASEVRWIRADRPDAAFRIFQTRNPEVLYRVEHQEDRFYITTNWKAKNFRLMECPLDHTDSSHWKEVIAHRPDVLLEDIEVFKDHIVLSERKNGLLQLRVRSTVTGQDHYIDFSEVSYLAYTGNNPEYNSTILRYGYTSLVTPPSIYAYKMDSREKQLLKQDPVVGGYKPTNYTVERLYVTARDGARVPLSIVYRNGLKKDGKAPLLLYGYGSYGFSTDDEFSSPNLSLLDRGFVFAIAHIRGGQEMGRSWYEDGKMQKKINTFTDFIDCGDYLVRQQYTSPAHLYANGGSAGGLLMGAITNMRPELWHGVIADVPFVDVINTMLDESIPLTTNEFNEWGNPKNKEAYLYMKSYAPYENVERKNYPNLLVTTGLHDSQVQYFEPAKWVAKMRTLKTDDNVLLLHTNMDYGHGGASGRFDYLKDEALKDAFLISLEKN